MAAYKVRDQDVPTVKTFGAYWKEGIMLNNIFKNYVFALEALDSVSQNDILLVDLLQ